MFHIPLDPLLLSRIQFAFVISFHIIFPAITIGLAAYLAVLEGLYLKTKHPVYKELYLFWLKLFAVCFGIGVVSGITMPYQFGTNWAPYAQQIGRVIGPLMGFEVLVAFFLEASFLAIMLFGWNKVSQKMHFFATVTVSIGTMISAFWIISANSWMQTPQGFTIDANGMMNPTNWLEIIFNPSFWPRFIHMMLAAFLSTAFLVGATGAWYLWTRQHIAHARIMVGMALLMAAFVTPVQIAVGDWHGLNTLEHQPRKIAAMEGIWHTEKNAPLIILGYPDEKNETTHSWLSVPNGGSLILTHKMDGEIKGLTNWAKEDRPPVLPVFLAFRTMVGIGMLMLLTGFVAGTLWLRGRLFDNRWLYPWLIAMAPSGIIAILAGWFTTEIGRQPYVVYGVMRTRDALSPVTGEQVAISLALYIVSYSLVFSAGVYYMFKTIRRGPMSGTWAKTFDAPAHSRLFLPLATDTTGWVVPPDGDQDVKGGPITPTLDPTTPF